ncbi:hypothetical protein FOBRF1_009884 [Fusarium oxysporum]
MAEPLGCVQDLLRAGADPRAKDGKGNTALHYLADDDLTGIWYATEKREMFYVLLKIAFCDDINIPNNAGKTVAELILDDNGRMDDGKVGETSMLRFSMLWTQPGLIGRPRGQKVETCYISLRDLGLTRTD